MWKQVDTKIALGMIIGFITGVTFGVILVLMFSSNKDVVFNDFKEKTKKFKENSEYVFLDNVSETNRDEILEYAELKGYQLYNFIDNSNNNFNTNTYNTMIFLKNNIEN
jgi:hypothetical protein